MAKTLQFRRGTTSELSSITGSVGELFINTENNTIVVMDGSTPGGFEIGAGGGGGGGTSWQAVKTLGFTAVSGEGYFCNTTSSAFTATLPASPTLGDEISFIDYAGTFDTNNLTVARNGNPIQGDASDLTVSVVRSAFTLVYVDGTQGWLLKDN